MNYRIPPKVAVINSFAGYGRCSITEALPIISAMRVQACPVPTSVFSNHTGFPSWFVQDFTSQMPGYLESWEKLGVSFDGIYSGFLGKREQISTVADFVKSQRALGCSMVLVDPVMGDHGKLYATLEPSHCEALKELVSLADILTPNLTEACLLTGTPYKEEGWTDSELETLCEKLHALGPDKVVVTGLLRHACELPEGFLNCVSERSCRTVHVFSPSAGPSRHGTGDIFAAIVAAEAVKQKPFAGSIQKAADFISACIRLSDELGIPETDGVCFENLLDQLF